jgi:class 3 adenylate cyclase
LLYSNPFALSIDEQFQIPEARAYFEALASRATLVINDARGAGASERAPVRISAEADAEDLAAVADAAGLQAFPLFSDVMTGASVRYTLDHPGRVERLILWFPRSSLSDHRMRENAQGHRTDWQYARRIWADRLAPSGPVPFQRAINRALKNSLNAEVAAQRFEQDPHSGASLGDVTVPTLLLERTALDRRAAMEAASEIQRSTLRLVGGDTRMPYPVHEEIVAAVFEFLELNANAAASAPTAAGTNIILFTDIVDSTPLNERMGDAAFRALSRSIDERVRSAIRDHGGTPVEGKVLGDGVMGVFPSAAQAIAAARVCVELGRELPMHIGLHAGDVLSEGSNVYGGAVNIASRICGLCAPGEILVSATVRDLARTSAGVTFEDRGEQTLKGIDDPVRLFAVPVVAG